MTSKFLNLRWTSVRKGVRNTVIFTPLEGESLEVCAAGHGIIGGSPQWADGEVVKEAFKGPPALMSSMIGFYNP